MANVLDLDFDYFMGISNDSKILDEYKSDLAPSHKACYVSHYKVWELIAYHNYESALILEDDVDFEMDISRIMTKVHRYLPAYWEMLYLGHCSYEGDDDFYVKSHRWLGHYFVGLFKSKAPACTHAYAISSFGASKLLKEVVDPKEPVDVELVFKIQTGNIISYSLEPSIIVQWKNATNPSNVSPGKNDYTQWWFLKSSTMHHVGLI
ncbi:hypothetical protein C1645_813686 [Glomus cerebriforme]|uniref:Glycosyl transferase family 25 domain-containing protein n=1 Tax=Glomus cerebriforme TaxID=658196 RepID=A0A397TSD5_9GLOM|nr:hypothetical protein C1645_813686 [Glomus cerebriforme]